MAEKHNSLKINTVNLINGSNGDITTSTTINPGSSAIKSVVKTAVQPKGEEDSPKSDHSHKLSGCSNCDEHEMIPDASRKVDDNSSDSSGFCNCGHEHHNHVDHQITEENVESPGSNIIKKINSSGHTKQASKSLRLENHMQGPMKLNMNNLVIESR